MATNHDGHDNSRAGTYVERESTASLALRGFSPLWFTICMDTGIISIIMKLLPYQFTGLGTLTTIMFVLNLVLFILFSCICILRHYKYGSYIKNHSLNDFEALSYLGAPPTAYLTLVAQVALTCSTAWGYNWTILAYVLWWIGLVWTTCVCFLTVVVLARRNITSAYELSPVVLLPLVSAMTQGTVGGIITNYSVGITARLAIPVIVVGYMVIGYGLFMGLMYYALITHRLLAVGPLPPEKRPAMIIAVGPLGQFATAIQLLSTAASKEGLFGEYNKGTFLQSNSASSVSAAAVLLALMTLGFSCLWVVVGWYVVIEAWVKRELPFALNWWSLIFPMGVFTSAILNLANAMDSPACRGLTTALLIFLLILYFINWGGTIYKTCTGHTLSIPQNRQREDEQAREKKERQHTTRHQNGHANNV